MKKNIYIVLFGLLLSMGVVSCDNDTELLFDESASQRKTEVVTEYNDALKSAEQGWLFQYFPEETQKYGGYNYVVKFNQHDSVTVWSEIMPDVTKPETSLYDVISYGGPVLTFNTYNSLMHHFANASAAEYLAKGGDFEFLIMSNERDEITLKGIKTGNTLRLTRMIESAEVYLQKINVISQLFKRSSLEGTIKDAEVGISLNDHRLVFSYTENDEIKSEKAAFIPTPTGISFYEPLSILGVTVDGLTLIEETNQLVSENNEIVLDIIKAPIDLVSTLWSSNMGVEDDRSSVVRAVWESVYVENGNVWGEVLIEDILFGLGIETTGMLMKSDVYYAQYNLTFGGVKGKAGYIGMDKVDGGYNWAWYTHLMPMVDIIVDNAPYIVVLDDEENPTSAKLTSAANADVWFVLRK